jgi:hypothetical protein
MKNLIITEEERSRILGMHQSATARQYLMEQADITKQIEAGFNQILTTLRTITMVQGTKIPVTFGNLVKDTANTDPNRIMYNIKINVGEPRPEEFTIKVGSMLDVTNPNNIIKAWQNYLIEDFKGGINNVQSNSTNWKSLKNEILIKLQSVNLTTPTTTTPTVKKP